MISQNFTIQENLGKIFHEQLFLLNYFSFKQKQTFRTRNGDFIGEAEPGEAQQGDILKNIDQNKPFVFDVCIILGV